MSVEGMIRRARLHAGLTQAQVAQRLGIAHQSVAIMEGKPNPSPAILDRYGKAMGYALVIFYERTAEDGTEIFIE